jgi:hypothetical protein
VGTALCGLAGEGAVAEAPPAAAGTCAKLTVAVAVVMVMAKPMIKVEIFEGIQLTFFKEIRCAGYRNADCI